MDLSKFDITALETILNGDDETKAEFARQFMPLCASEKDFHAALRDAIEQLKGQKEEIL